MTVTQQASKVTYAGNGQQVEFFVPFVFYDPEDLEVLKVTSDGSELTQVSGIDYTVYSGDQNGAVTMMAAPLDQERLVIVRKLPFEQPVDYRANDPFPAETHERGLDRLTLLCQQLDERLSRTFALSRGSISDPTLPPVSAGALIGWNAAGDGLENKIITLPEEAIIAGSGVTISNNELSIDLAQNSGLEINAGELLVKVDGVTVQRGVTGALELVEVSSPWVTGDVKITTRTNPDAGWLLMNGQTLGSADSEADHKGGQYQDLYVHLWTVMTNQWAPVSDERGETALQDWIDNKTLQMSAAAGRALIGQGAAPPFTTRELGETGGEEAHLLTLAEMPRHRHSMDGKRGGSQSNGGDAAFGAFSSSPNRSRNTNFTGNDQPHNNMPPFLALNVMIKI
ncbi:hypothetical protein [Denitrobaculum tricleocarpae]|uniref:Tail fiber protein n=1 Tax=Denitrobaculum tricleocarpae TaxID=2591009 RepID=A0A545TU72_9PROT|nr:hypothetical protein [Denitrobaculum tricleocarpae]TQV80769.1 hypothetical protein FKG95_11500 [Denitrobaculum tricleocarpae]